MKERNDGKTGFNRELGCRGKVMHKTYALAEKSMTARRRKINRGSYSGADGAFGKIVIYKCPNIEPHPHFHVGKANHVNPSPYNRRMERKRFAQE